MEKKLAAAVLAAMLLCAASCGSAEKQETAAPAAEEKPAVSAPASEITAAVLAQVPISSSVEKGIDDLEFYFGSLDTDGLEEASYCMCASGAYPDEIAVFRFSSPDLAEDGAEAVKERMEQQHKTYETYTPAEMYKFDGAVAEARGNYVIYLVTADNAAADKIVKGYIA